MFYDGFLVLALWFPATAMLLPFTDGEAISASNVAFPVYLLAWGYGYFLLSWRFGGRTLGMKAWRLSLVGPEDQGGRINWSLAWRYAAWASLSWLMLGGGFLLSWFRADRRSLHELKTGLKLVREPV